MDADIAPSWPHATDASQLAGCKREELQDLAREAEMPESEIALFTNHTMKREKFVAMLLKAQADTAVREATRQRLTLKTSLCFYCEGVKEMKVRDAKVTCPVCDGDGMVLPEQVEHMYVAAYLRPAGGNELRPGRTCAVYAESALTPCRWK